MNTTATYSDGNGTIITFKKSLRNQMFYHHLRDLLVTDDDQPDRGERFQYAFIAAYAVEVEGLQWTPPKMGDRPKTCEASYQAFLDAIPDYSTFNDLYGIIDSLHTPLADDVQKPDDALTDDERADPN